MDKETTLQADSGPPRWLPSLSLRQKVNLGILIPLVIVVSLFILVESARHRSAVLSNLSLLASHSARTVETNLRQQMLKSNFVELQALLDSIGSQEEFRKIYLLDTSGKVIFSPFNENLNSYLDVNQAECQICHSLSPRDRPRSVVVTEDSGKRVFRSMNPIENSPECVGCHGGENRLIGLLLTDIPMEPVEGPINAHLRESVLWWMSMIGIVVVVVNLALSRMVLSRLEALAQAMTSFGRSSSPVVLEDRSKDEIGQLSAAFNAMAYQVDLRSQENLTLSRSIQLQNAQRGELLKRLISAQEDERKRVARELHDELGQALGGLAFNLKAAQHLILTDTQRALKELDRTGDLIQNTTEQMYDLILALRPSLLDDLGLTAALHSYTSNLFKETGIEFTFESSRMVERLPSEIETALYRIFQEALYNIIRHAQASRVSLKLDYQEHVFTGEIADNGQGFDLDTVQINGSHSRGLGLLGMKERVALIGGSLTIHSQPGSGTWICVQIPIIGSDDGTTGSHTDC
jgi:signal transduction histidine kinase